jgi:uncharacterized membrane protein YdfJ with MMPL/SSD domain
MFTGALSMLGAKVTKVVEWYSQRAIGEVYDVVLCVFVIVVCLCVAKYTYKRIENWDEINLNNIVYTVGVAIAIAVSIDICIEISEAYKAMLSPKAYGLDQILKHWR